MVKPAAPMAPAWPDGARAGRSGTRSSRASARAHRWTGSAGRAGRAGRRRLPDDSLAVKSDPQFDPAAGAATAAAGHRQLDVRGLRTAVFAVAIVTFSVNPDVAASSTQPAPIMDDEPQLQALVGDPAELDATFGTGGKVMTNTGGHLASAVALQSDGKIVVAGAGPNDVAFGFARYTTSGSLDASFDGDGMANVDVGFSDVAVDMAIQSDGKIVAVGSNSPDGFCCAAAIVRLKSDGTPDSTFDSDGVVKTGSAAACSTPRGRHPGRRQDPGRRPRSGGGSGTFTIGRFTTTGELDSTFGTAGYVTTTDAASIWDLEDIAIQPDGKIVAVGRANNDFGVVRYTSGGVLDTTFDGDGIVMTNFGSSTDKATAVALQGDGKIVVAGTGNDRFAVARYTTAGALDPTLDGDGSVTTTFFGNEHRERRRRRYPVRRQDCRGRDGIRRPRLRVRDRPIRHRRLAQRPDDHGLRRAGQRRGPWRRDPGRWADRCRRRNPIL